jgi:3-hydroxyisobutyrate dehydrogenase
VDVTADDAAARRVGFAGLGQMGFHLAQHVQAAAASHGAAVVAYDPSPAMRERASAAGLATLDVPFQGLGRGDVLCLSVPDGAAVRAVLAGLGDLGRCRGLTVLDHSSVSAEDAVDIGRSMAEHGIRYIDAPVTGGVLAAEQATLTTIVGGTESDLSTVGWIPGAFSKRVVYADRVGAAALLKSINNMIFNVASIASMEGILLARSAGIADETLLDVLNSGTGVTYFSQVRYPKYIATGGFDAGMRVGLVNKDLQIALDAARAKGVDLPLCATGRAMWADALAVLGPNADSTEMMDTVSRAVTGKPVRQVLGQE